MATVFVHLLLILLIHLNFLAWHEIREFYLKEISSLQSSLDSEMEMRRVQRQSDSPVTAVGMSCWEHFAPFWWATAAGRGGQHLSR